MTANERPHTQCRDVFTEYLAEHEGIEAHVTEVRPLNSPLHRTPLVCIHGVRFYVEPTSEWIMQRRLDA